MSYRARMEVLSIGGAIRALDLLHRLDVPMLDMETARQERGFLVHLSYDAPGEEAARHICVRMGQIVDVIAEMMVPGAPRGSLFPVVASAEAAVPAAAGCPSH